MAAQCIRLAGRNAAGQTARRQDRIDRDPADVSDDLAKLGRQGCRKLHRIIIQAAAKPSTGSGAKAAAPLHIRQKLSKKG